MKNIVKLTTPLDPNRIETLRCGDFVEITGTIYTARDAAHKRMKEMLEKNMSLPFDLSGQIIYYAGPCPAKPGQVIGSIGPTTSGRMDVYTPLLLKQGLAGMIGKGKRSQEVIDAMIRYKSVYFGATGGAGALISKCVKKAEVIAFDDLGTEAIRRLYVEDLPVIVLIDCKGNKLYKEFDK
ncbi:MAG: Fe-S-containing hydro-lyase [Clostridia bacterium]|jgi:fumarate hydratase subunit beta|nr:Fe-S-containing hydro-lyase [Clostridiaceae bacterium]